MSRRDEKREKASDVFRQSTPFLGSLVSSFEEAFPEIEDVHVEAEEFTYSFRKKYVLNKSNFKEYIDCTNDSCYNGGLAVGNFIRQMVYSKKAEDEAVRKCQGYEGSTKGRKKYADCAHSFKIKASIKFNDASKAFPTKDPIEAST